MVTEFVALCNVPITSRPNPKTTPKWSTCLPPPKAAVASLSTHHMPVRLTNVLSFRCCAAEWLCFERHGVRRLGSRYEDVRAECVASRFKPLLLFYQLQHPAPDPNSPEASVPERSDRSDRSERREPRESRPRESREPRGRR